ncbi:MAG: hypothetical protein M3Q31_12180 [Actinomycetota bacterium]|nr:hypothetical protein [Actinomycetota bacterium]
MAQLSRAVDEMLDGSSATASTAPRVLVVQLKIGSILAGYSAVFAQALRLRGAEVGLLVCGGGQPACEVGWNRSTYPFPCNRCSWFTETWARAQGLSLFALGDHIPWGRDASRAPLDLPAGSRNGDGVNLDDATKVSVPRFFLAAQHEDLPHSREISRDFRVAAHGLEEALAPILDEFAPDVVVVYNGLITSEYVVKRMAELRGARAVTYSSGFLPGSLMFSDGEPAERMDSDGWWPDVGARPLTPEQEHMISDYMHARSKGRDTYGRYFHRTRDEDLLEELGVSGYERVATVFTNITWDTGCLDRDVGFSSMRAWAIETIEAAREHPDTAILVRIHPEEIRWGSQEMISDAIDEAFTALPPNVRVIGPDDSINSYALMDSSDVVITYTTTAGLEAAVRGRPVAVCGEAHYRGKGFTIDVDDIAGLHEVLDGRFAAPEGQVELALRFAFMFFLRMCVPFPAVREARDGTDALEVIPVTAQALAPGADPYLDLVCDRILAGGDFLVPEELVMPPHHASEAST